MERTPCSSEDELTERLLAEATARLDRQAAVVERLIREGRDATTAVLVLRHLEDTLEVMRQSAR